MLVNGFIGAYTNGWTRTANMMPTEQQGIATELVIQPQSDVETLELILPVNLDIKFLDIFFPFPDKNNDKNGNGTSARLPDKPPPKPVFGVSLV
jgi:hypothetical protein